MKLRIFYKVWTRDLAWFFLTIWLKRSSSNMKRFSCSISLYMSIFQRSAELSLTFNSIQLFWYIFPFFITRLFLITTPYNTMLNWERAAHYFPRIALSIFYSILMSTHLVYVLNIMCMLMGLQLIFIIFWVELSFWPY